jgi:hypothetical protein
MSAITVEPVSAVSMNIVDIHNGVKKEWLTYQTYDSDMQTGARSILFGREYRIHHAAFYPHGRSNFVSTGGDLCHLNVIFPGVLPNQ